MKMRLGLPYRIKNRVLEFEENRLIAWGHLGGHRWRFELQASGSQTLVRETFDWSTSRWPFMIELARYPRRHKKNIEATLERLASLVGLAVSVFWRGAQWLLHFQRREFGDIFIEELSETSRGLSRSRAKWRSSASARRLFFLDGDDIESRRQFHALISMRWVFSALTWEWRLARSQRCRTVYQQLFGSFPSRHRNRL